MKRILLAMLICSVVLCSCSSNTEYNGNVTPDNNTSNIEEEEQINDETIFEDPSQKSSVGVTTAESIVGVWEHKQYPDNYHFVIRNSANGGLDIYLVAFKGANASQIAIAKVKDVQFDGNTCEFDFMDSFENTGKCILTINGEEIIVSYNTDQPYKGGWCVDAGVGTYVKTDASTDIADQYEDW